MFSQLFYLNHFIIFIRPITSTLISYNLIFLYAILVKISFVKSLLSFVISVVKMSKNAFSKISRCFQALKM